MGFRIQFSKIRILTDIQYWNIMNQIAQNHNTTSFKVEQEIFRCIDAAKAAPDPIVKTPLNELLKHIGHKPTPKEFLSAVVSRFRKP